MRGDRFELRRDEADLRRDLRFGNSADIARDRADIRRDSADLRRDRRISFATGPTFGPISSTSAVTVGICSGTAAATNQVG